MDKELFSLAVTAALRIPTSGIGTLSEKTIHAAIKYYVQPDKDKHEIKFRGGVADALSEDGVFEIQTKGFYRLSKKLEILLKSGTVTVVYPIVAQKKLYITDFETGETTVRKSPLKGSVYDVFYELFGIRRFITSDNFRLRLITVNADERKTVRVRVSKKGRKTLRTLSSEIIPTELLGDETLNNKNDYLRFIPETLPDTFTSLDYARECSVPRSVAQATLSLLNDINVVERIGKKGNAYIYKTAVNTK